MHKFPANADLHVFITVVRKQSFAAAADSLGASPAYVSKRVHLLEESLGTQLFHRTTRRVALTEQGERVYDLAQQVLDNIDHLMQEVGASRRVPSGPLRVSSSFGFGRRLVAPALSRLSQQYPSLQIRLEVFDRLVDVATEEFDLDVRVGDEIAPHLIARRLGDNHRVLCAAPSYLARRGTPQTLEDLADHCCLVIKERDHPFGVWKLRQGTADHTVKVPSTMLSTNNGEIALSWAVEGCGIMLRSLWNVRSLLRRGLLVQVLPDCTQEANFWAVYPSRLETSAKVRTTVEFLQAHFRGLQAEVPA